MTCDARYNLERQALEAGERAVHDRMNALVNSTLSTVQRGEKFGWTCPVCGQAFQFHSFQELERTPCQCGTEAKQTAYQEYKRVHRVEAIAQCWGSACIPRRFVDKTFANFTKRPGTEKAMAACKAYIKGFQLGQTSTGLFFAGTYGSGKTHLAVATARALVERDLVDVHFAGTGTMLTQLKASDFDWDDVLKATKAEMLILDDLAQDALSSYDRRILFDLLNERYEQLRPTMFTTNAGEKQLVDLLGGSFVSRLYEMATLVEVNSSDYRRGPG